MNESKGIESVLQENRVFDPPRGFSEDIGGAWIPSMDDYRAMWQRSIDDPESFWDEAAREFHWFKPYDKVLEWNCPDARFVPPSY